MFEFQVETKQSSYVTLASATPTGEDVYNSVAEALGLNLGHFVLFNRGCLMQNTRHVQVDFGPLTRFKLKEISPKSISLRVVFVSTGEVLDLVLGSGSTVGDLVRVCKAARSRWAFARAISSVVLVYEGRVLEDHDRELSVVLAKCEGDVRLFAVRRIVLLSFCKKLVSNVLSYMRSVYYDPWVLVRPSRIGGVPSNIHRLGPSINARALTQAPGTNPLGEDLTALLTTGLVNM